MMKSIRTLVRQDREKYVIPRRVQDVIPIQKIWEDGIFLTGGRYAKSFRFTDINYQVASEPDKEKMFRGYSAIINSLDCGATTKITIFNHRMSQINFEKSILMPMQWDGLDDYREEYNQMLLDKATKSQVVSITLLFLRVIPPRKRKSRSGRNPTCPFVPGIPPFRSRPPREPRRKCPTQPQTMLPKIGRAHV